MRLRLRSLLAALLAAVAALAFVLAVSARERDRQSEQRPDLDAWCKRRWGQSAAIVVRGTGPYDHECRRIVEGLWLLEGVDVNDACAVQFPGSTADFQSEGTDPHWRCTPS